MTNGIFQSVISQLKDVTDRVFGVVDAEGFVIACTDPSLMGERWPEVVLKVTGSTEQTVTFAQRTYRSALQISLSVLCSAPVRMSGQRPIALWRTSLCAMPNPSMRKSTTGVHL